MLKCPKDLVQQVGNVLFSLFLLVLMLDPGNAILHLKDKFFILFLGYNLLFLKPDLRFLLPIFTVFALLFFGFIMGNVQGNPIDLTYMSGVFKGVSPLVLLLWVKHYDVLKLARIPALITCVVILILYGFIVSSDAIQYAVFLYSKQHNEMVMITTRNLLGIKFFGMYYRSIVSIIPILFCVLFTAFSPSHKRKRHFFFAIILTTTFFISGTRAMMLTPLFVIGILLFNKFSQYPRGKYLLYPLLISGVFAFLLLIFLLATQEGDASNTVKYGHLASYARLFNEHPQYLLWGQGTGSTFYSEGFNAVTAETEWIYLELLRNFGVLSLFILGVYFFPLYIFFRHRQDKFTAGFGLCYFGFLLIAGTNPFLLNSQGMTVLWMVYSHAYHVSKASESCQMLK